jgi:hypothetical protein
MSSSSTCLILPPQLFEVKIKALQSIADQSALQASVSERRVIELTYENEQVAVMMNYSICYQLSALPHARLSVLAGVAGYAVCLV